MPEVKRKIPMLGQEIEVTDVPIKTCTEPFSNYELEDGSVLRVKHVATSFLRVEGQTSPDGKPVYLVTSSPVIHIERSGQFTR